jgi:lipoyl(octanoyl) transferase
LSSAIERSTSALPLLTRYLGVQPYETVWQRMREFTDRRDAQTADELWLVQHPPVFTQGQAGRAEHLLNPGDIPVVQTDRGGQVTYHGPGQLVAYPLLDLRRLGLGVRDLVSLLENTVIQFLAGWNLEAVARPDAPGVYVDGRKIASLGLRVRRGCSFHGVSLNLHMDLAPFQRINPCGYNGLQMTQLADWVEPSSLQLARIEQEFAQLLATNLGFACSQS